MKKLIAALILLLVLVGCSSETKIHKNISESIAKDTLQVLEIIEGNIENDTPINQDVLDKYMELYRERMLEVISEEETNVLHYTRFVIENVNAFTDITLESDKEKFYNEKELILYTIEHGEKKLD